MKHYILNLWFLNINRSMSEWICPKRQKKRWLVYVMTTYLRQHGLMSFISLSIPEREINLHFVNSAGLQQNAPFCVLLKKKSFFHGFIILYLKFWLHRFYIQNAAFCILLTKKDPPTAFSFLRVAMYAITPTFPMPDEFGGNCFNQTEHFTSMILHIWYKHTQNV